MTTVCRSPAKTRRAKGFSLIELLLVMAILAVLLAILTPSLRHARVLARRAVCASNLHQWGVAVSSYAGQNAGQLMRTSIHPLTGYAGPEIVRVQATAQGEWCVGGINPFADAFDEDARKVRGIGLCPEMDESFFEYLSNAHWNSGHNFTQLTYGYLARVDKWPDWAMNGAEDDLTAKHLSSSRLLMGDVLMLDGNTGRFRYNHSRFGWVWNWRDYGNLVDYGPPRASGLNQLFGGGNVHWKPATELDLEHMADPAGYRDGWVFRGANRGIMYY